MLIAKAGLITLLTALLSAAGLWLLAEAGSSVEAEAIAAAQNTEYIELIRDGDAHVAVQMEF